MFSMRAGEITQHVLQLIGVRPRAENAFLRPPQLRGGDGLHRLRQLLRVLYRTDAAADIQEDLAYQAARPFSALNFSFGFLQDGCQARP